MKYVKKLDINGVEIRLTSCIELHGRPNAATEGAVGVMGVDVDSPSHQMYVCIAVNGAIHTWIPVTNGGSGGTGVDGITPHIGANGNWYLGDEDTGVCATGTHVVSVEEVNRDATLSTYRMNFSDGEGYEFTVYHGKDGADGKSAYAYAKDGGYTGTEEEFVAKLAQGQPVVAMTKAEFSALTAENVADLYSEGSRLLLVEDGYTNLVSSAIGENGAIYYGCGYLDGYRLTASGTLTAGDSMCLSGYVAYPKNSVVRVVGSTVSASAGGQYVAAYDSSFGLISVKYMTALISGGSATYESRADGFFELTMNTSKISDWSNAAYFRVSCASCTGADLVITVNEEIGLGV